MSCKYYDLQDRLVSKEEFPVNLELVSIESSSLLTQVFIIAHRGSQDTDTNVALRMRRISPSVWKR